MTEPNQDDRDNLALLANGRLSPGEAERLKRAMEDDPALADETRFLAALGQGLKDLPESTPGALGLARLKRDIASEQKTVPGKPTVNHWWKPVAVAACCLLAVQTGLVVITTVNRSGPADVTITPLAGNSAASGTLASGPRLQLAFSPQATAAQIQQALQAVNARIIDGPGALGIYTLVLPEGADVQAAEQTLRQQPIVEEVNAQ